MLLVLDSCDHVVEAAASLEENLLKGAQGLNILATIDVYASLSSDSSKRANARPTNNWTAGNASAPTAVNLREMSGPFSGAQTLHARTFRHAGACDCPTFAATWMGLHSRSNWRLAAGGSLGPSITKRVRLPLPIISQASAREEGASSGRQSIKGSAVSQARLRTREIGP